MTPRPGLLINPRDALEAPQRLQRGSLAEPRPLNVLLPQAEPRGGDSRENCKCRQQVLRIADQTVPVDGRAQISWLPEESAAPPVGQAVFYFAADGLSIFLFITPRFVSGRSISCFVASEGVPIVFATVGRTRASSQSSPPPLSSSSTSSPRSP